MEPKNLSRLTIALGAYIVISAAFMLQARNWLFKTFGESAVTASFKASFLLLALFAITYAFKKARLPALRACAIGCIFILAYLFAMQQQFFSEKTHVLTYGLLGYMAAKDLACPGKRWRIKYIAAALFFVAFISALDETFQWFLPYRYGELKDFITNIISGSMGIALLFCLPDRN